MEITPLTDQIKKCINVVTTEIERLRRSTCLVDRDLARSSLEKIYKDVGLVPAAEVIWFESPMAALEFIASKHPDQLGDYVGKVISKSWESLSSGFGNDQIDAVAILDLMGAIVRGRRPISKDACQFDEFALHQEPFSIDALLIFGKFEMMRLSGLPQSLEMAAITQLVQNVDGCWPFAKVVVMSDRPELMVWNADMKLHCEIGPAIQFRDGREEFYLYHERVSELAVRKPETITVNDIDSEPKNQKRRVKVARYKVGTPIRGGGKRPFKHDD